MDDIELRNAVLAGISYARVPMYSAPIDPIVAQLRTIGAAHALASLNDAWRTYDDAYVRLRIASFELRMAIEHAQFVTNSRTFRTREMRLEAAKLLDVALRTHKAALNNYSIARSILAETRANWRVYLGIAGRLWREHSTIDPFMVETLDAHRRAQKRQDAHAKRMRRARVSRERVNR